MRKHLIILIAVVFAVTMGLCLTACGTSEFSMQVNDEKSMTITAENSDVDDFAMVGTLVVAEGETIAIEPALEEGVIELGFAGGEGMDDIEEVPDVEVDENLITEVSGTEAQTMEVPEGSYLVKATVIEKATGTIEITIK